MQQCKQGAGLHEEQSCSKGHSNACRLQNEYFSARHPSSSEGWVMVWVKSGHKQQIQGFFFFFYCYLALAKLASGVASGCGLPMQMRHGYFDANWGERWICQRKVRKRAAWCFQKELGSQCFQQKKQPDFRVQRRNKSHKLQLRKFHFLGKSTMAAALYQNPKRLWIMLPRGFLEFS